MRSGGGILVVNRSSDLFIGRGRRTHPYRCTQTFSRWFNPARREVDHPVTHGDLRAAPPSSFPWPWVKEYPRKSRLHDLEPMRQTCATRVAASTVSPITALILAKV